LALSLYSEGLLVFVTLAPKQLLNKNEINIEKVDFTEIGQIAYSINLLQFDWSTSYENPSLQTATYIGNEFINYAKTIKPAEKIYIGLSSIAYDWPLPYVVGVTKTNSLTTNAAIELAFITGATISYDELAEAAYFQYYQNKTGFPILHLVWFRDARSVNFGASQLQENGFIGLSIWNIMYFFAQMWLVINSQYEIETIIQN